MLEDFDKGLSATAQLVDALQRQPGLSEHERSRLKTLLQKLISTISAYQNDLPTAIEQFCDNPREKSWGHLVAHVEALMSNVRRMMTLLEREKGDFIVNRSGTYRDIAVTLGTRGRVLAEINAMTYPPSDDDIARLRSIATTYRGLVSAIRRSEDELADYIRTNGPSSSQIENPATLRTDVVILVHGIRDFALWQNSVRTPLKAAGFAVEPTNYGRLNLIRFLVPFAWFRKSAIKAIEEQIRMVGVKHRNKRISVIAHSFGTYVIASLLRDEFDFELHRVIFCGSVVPYDFPFEAITHRFQPDLLNEVGTADIWPAFAESVTRGYGSAGSYGFRRPFVTDRWHNGAGHGFFLTPAFASTFWVPFLESGKIVPGSDPAEEPSRWIKTISVLKLKYAILSAFAAGLIAVLLALIAALEPLPGPIPQPIPAPQQSPGAVVNNILRDVDLGYAEGAILQKLGAPTYTSGRSDIIDLDDHTLDADLKRQGRYFEAIENEGFVDGDSYFDHHYRQSTWRIGDALLIIRFDKKVARVSALRVELPLGFKAGSSCLNVAPLGPLRHIVNPKRQLCLGGATIADFNDPAIGLIRTPYGADGGWNADCEGEVDPGGASGHGAHLSLRCKKVSYPSSRLGYDIELGHEGTESVTDAYSTFGGSDQPDDEVAKAYAQFVGKYGAYTVNVIEIYAMN